jgi:hypothetical protein
METWINVQEMYRDFLSAGIIMDVWQEVIGRECVSHRITYADPTEHSPLLPTEDLWR